WVRLVADQLAEAGYIAVAPDLLSGSGPKGGGTDSFKGEEVRKAIMSLPPDRVTADLTAAAEYAAKLPACNGKVAVAGFCWARSPSNRGCRNRPFCVHSANPTSATSSGRTQWTPGPSGGSPAANGDVRRSSRPSRARSARRVSRVYPVPTFPA